MVCLTQGEVVALDKIRNKIGRIRQNAQMLRLRSIKVYCFDSTRAVSSDPTAGAEGTEPHDVHRQTDNNNNTWKYYLCCVSPIPGPPFPPESFDRVLLDAPCSGLGQRPNMSCTWSLKEICSYQPLQRKLFQAVSVTEHRGE